MTIVAAQQALNAGQTDKASEILEKLGSRHPGDLHLLALRSQAATEFEQWELALSLAQATSRLAVSQDVGKVQSAHILMAVGRRSDALQALANVAEDNIVASSLREILRFFGTAAATEDTVQSDRSLALPRWSLWFEPVLSALLFEIDGLLTSCPPSEVHRVRAALIRPNLEPSMFRPPTSGLFERLFSKLSSQASRQRRDREREIVGHFYREDLEGAALALQSWLRDAPSAYVNSGTDSDPRQSLLIETNFALNRFREVIDIFERTSSDNESIDLPERLLAVYAYLATSRDRQAQKTLAGLADGSPDAPTSHLTAVCELQAGRPGAGLGWLRRAVRANDIAMVNLAYVQLEAVGVNLVGPVTVSP